MEGLANLFPFGWQHYLLGGLLIGAGVALMFVMTGLIGGMSTVFSSTWSFWVRRPFFQQERFVSSRSWRLVYALGLVLGALVWRLGFAADGSPPINLPVWQLLLGGFLVGYGARLGNGCTSGHGICGPGFAAVALAAGGARFHGHGFCHRPPGGLGAGMSAARLLVVLLAGALFGFGLALSTMVRPEIVLGFLRFQDWGLMLVMGGAVLVTLLAYQLAPRLMRRPVLGGPFQAHPSAWNRDTALGAALFGVGWGLCGVCPGPAIAGLGTGNVPLLWALGGIALGALAQGLVAARSAG